MLPQKKVRFSAFVEEVQTQSPPTKAPPPPTMDPALRRGTCLPLDLTIPTSVLLSRVDDAVLNKAACTPAVKQALIRVSSARSATASFSFELIAGPEPISVRDVFRAVSTKLRDEITLSSLSPRTAVDVERYHTHRVCTFVECMQDLDSAARRRELRDAEVKGGARHGDLLGGDVRFDGIFIQSSGNGEPGCWLVELLPEERYATA